MPSKPKALPGRVRVRHEVSGAEKDVLRSQLGALSPRWRRVTRRGERVGKAKQPDSDTNASPEVTPTADVPAEQPDSNEKE